MATAVEAERRTDSPTSVGTPTREDTDIIGKRVGAELIDNVLMFVLYVAVMVPFVGASALLGGAGGDTAAAAAMGGALVGTLLASLSLYLYNVGLEGWWDGQTVGKRLLGITVVQEDGSDVTPGKAAIRAAPLLAMAPFGMLGVIGGILSMPVFGCFLVVGIVSIAVSDKRQRLADRVAGTVVVEAH
ncbi:RDD family protein [Halobium salinum]|uniref:RDD family protein n=1 Tax=Halobium salinum TaxID=1364940 RepID=A0ABD5PHV1_9EURY|nr:RDD family protein [Halobium salinum]